MSDVTAFNNCMSVFWRQHEAELSRFLTSKTGDSEKAADLLQELFLRARAHSDNFCEMENPRAWLYRAARNLLIDEYRTTREFVELEEEAPLPDVSHDAISTLDICLPETLQALRVSQLHYTPLSSCSSCCCKERRSSFSNGKLRNSLMRLAICFSTSTNAWYIASESPSASAGSLNPQWAVSGWPGNTGHPSPAILSHKVKMKSIFGESTC